MSPQNIQYTFDDFVLLPQEGLLLQNDKVVPLTYRALKVLELLVSKHGRVVQKGEFMETVWENSFVEEGNLPVAINAIRKVLDKEGHKTIETFPRRGYRFNCNVEKTFIVETEQIPVKSPQIESADSNRTEKVSTNNLSPKTANSFFRLFSKVPVKFLQFIQPAYLKQIIQRVVTT